MEAVAPILLRFVFACCTRARSVWPPCVMARVRLPVMAPAGAGGWERGRAWPAGSAASPPGRPSCFRGGGGDVPSAFGGVKGRRRRGLRAGGGERGERGGGVAPWFPTSLLRGGGLWPPAQLPSLPAQPPKVYLFGLDCWAATCAGRGLAGRRLVSLAGGVGVVVAPSHPGGPPRGPAGRRGEGLLAAVCFSAFPGQAPRRVAVSLPRPPQCIGSCQGAAVPLRPTGRPRAPACVRLLFLISLMINSQHGSATGYSPHELFIGRPAWFLHASYPEGSYSMGRKWVEEQQDKVDTGKAMLHRVRERQWNKKNKHWVPASYQERDWVLVHHSWLPTWPRSTSDDPYFGPYKIVSVDGHRITVRCSRQLGGTLVCTAQHLKRYYDPEDLCGEEWEPNDEEIAALDLQGAASPIEVEGELPNMNAEEMAKERFQLVQSFADTAIAKGVVCSTFGKDLEGRKLPGSPLLPSCFRSYS